jgi:hypothetical protein
MNPRFLFAYRFLAVAVVAAGFPAVDGSAQTVRPVIVEYKGAAKGKLELVNNGFQPANVVIEPRSFTITEDGDGVYGPLAKDIHLKLSAMTLRIPPKQSRYVFYEAKADTLPAWFVIYSVFAGPVQQTGLNIQLDLPHTVYLLQQEPLERPDVRVESLDYQPDKHRVVIVIANQSEKLGRALEWQVASRGTKAGGPGFPLLPQSRRQLEVAWNAVDAPDTFSVHFEHFSLKEAFSVPAK